MGRNYNKVKTYSAEVADMVGRIYYRLRSLYCEGNTGNYCGCSKEDIFSDTILLVIQDEAARCIKTPEEMAAHFGYRYNMVRYRTIRDSIQERMELYGSVKDGGYEALYDVKNGINEAVLT